MAARKGSGRPDNGRRTSDVDGAAVGAGWSLERRSGRQQEWQRWQRGHVVVMGEHGQVDVCAD